MSEPFISPHRSLRALALAVILSAAIAVGALALCVVLSGCGQKGPLYLPQQKKTRVPATPSNPTPDAPDTSGDTPGNSPTETSPSDTSPPTIDSTPPA
jgi:predicted small lipoprotein YifL